MGYILQYGIFFWMEDQDQCSLKMTRVGKKGFDGGHMVPI